MSELKPCPFCGSEADVLTSKSLNGVRLYEVMCNCCTGRTDLFDTEDGAISSWNSRVEQTCRNNNPCPFSGVESEYLRFLDLCAERANKIWRENEVRILADVYKSMDFVQIVRCRDCKHYDRMNDDEGMCMVPDDDGDYARWIVDEDGFCYLGMK